MNSIRLYPLAIALLSSTAAGAEFNLELALLPHVRRITYGDPLYIEVTILNRGSEVVTGPSISRFLPAFSFMIYDPVTHFEVSHL